MTAGTDARVTDADPAARFLRDPELFTEVHDRYFTAIHRYVTGRVGAQTAEDIAAETFLVAFDRRNAFDPARGDVRVWLFGIATNPVARHRRKEARHYRAPARMDADPVVEGHESTVVASVAARRLRPQPAKAPARLTRGERDVLLLVSLGELGYGPEILLATATAAERSPECSGAYWYVKVTTGGGDPREVYEYWVEKDGGLWFRGVKTGGGVTPLDLERRKPFSLFAVDLTFGELRSLPTDPEALKSWITEAGRRGDPRSSAGEFTDEDREMATFHSLIALVSTVPATPESRAAAFRAIASYPGVENVGAVPGGQGLVLPGGPRLVVDPATGRVNGTSVYITVYTVADPAGARIDAEWTATLPG